jgi:hypothetical protein
MKDKKCQSQLFPIIIGPFVKTIRIFVDDPLQNRMLICFLNTHDHFKGNIQISLMMLNILRALYAQQPSFKICWVFQLGHYYTFRLRPLIKHGKFINFFLVLVIIVQKIFDVFQFYDFGIINLFVVFGVNLF